jgi:hypothetical protein
MSELIESRRPQGQRPRREPAHVPGGARGTWVYRTGEGAFESDAYVLFGRGTSDDFALHAVGTEPGRNRVTTGAHIAFRAANASAVERWHAAAVRTGGTDNGAPGVRPEYSGRYYAAFVLDPDRNNAEAVYHEPAGSSIGEPSAGQVVRPP